MVRVCFATGGEMKIYELKRAPNARRVRMFLAEKGIEMAYHQIDLGAGENLAPEFLAKNPAGRIPVLELDDGTYLSETLAICRYFEELHPEPNLFGRTALERATVEMWSRFIEFNLWLPTGMAFRHITGFYKDRETGVKSASSRPWPGLPSSMPGWPSSPMWRGSASPSPTSWPCAPSTLARSSIFASPPNSGICRPGTTG
jgi:hypothetical protein